jgi:hypothetical protein
MKLEANPLEQKIKQQNCAARSLSCLGCTHLSRMKIKTMHLAVSPNLKIRDSEVRKKWVSLY